MEEITLFPQLIHKINIPEHQTIKDRFAGKFIKAFKEQKTKKADWADLCNSWQVQSDDSAYLFNQYFSTHVNNWFDGYGYPKIEYKITPWCNVHTYDMYQEAHNHMGPNVLLCGIYYLKFDNEKDRAVVFNANSAYMDFLYCVGVEPRHHYFGKRSHGLLKIKEGDLILFTPDQQHFAPCAKEKHEGHRITISFNIHKISCHTKTIR